MRKLQIDAIGQVEGTRLMKCKLCIDGYACTIFMELQNYKALVREKVFIRDGKSKDSAGAINTTKVFIEN